MKVLVGAFNQEKALVGAFYVIVKTGKVASITGGGARGHREATEVLTTSGYAETTGHYMPPPPAPGQGGNNYRGRALTHLHLHTPCTLQLPGGPLGPLGDH